ncbi:MAG: PaaI family thioesterase [Candidatus Competibacteraceae bacterium]|nr:PaaI family thioesterase [Candidatus Competibacteraceae bacterium]
MSSTQLTDHDWLAYPRAMAGPIYEHLGFSITDGGKGWLEITLAITPQLLNKDGVLHGGMWTLIADAAMGGACRTRLDSKSRVVTSQMDFRWLRALSGDHLRGVGRVLSRSRSVWHCTCELYNPQDVQIGFGSGSFIVMPYSPPL